ncbi:hypothetical protein [Cytophaga aurantiaca]|uniref:hypothetical protein n=1 Tax=Cytophaga aurantiaca TaxID=29530 RepID=UPI000360DD32|nr:hypothetical protein [Cytophaga aurantiaca]
MKTVFMPFTVTIVFGLIVLSSCSSGKKMQTASTPETKVQKEKEVASAKKTETVVPKTKSATTLPAEVKDNFGNRFPLAKDVSWETYSDLANTEKTNYSVVFVESGKTHWIIYSSTGDIIEERKEIEIDQLPQNIYNVIKEKYSTYKIVSAATYSHINKEGSYVVVLKPVSQNDAKEIEVIFRENASQVG